MKSYESQQVLDLCLLASFADPGLSLQISSHLPPHSQFLTLLIRVLQT